MSENVWGNAGNNRGEIGKVSGRLDSTQQTPAGYLIALQSLKSSLFCPYIELRVVSVLISVFFWGVSIDASRRLISETIAVSVWEKIKQDLGA